MKKVVRNTFIFAFFLVGIFPLLNGETSWDGEKLALEITMQKRVETALEKILPAGRFVVVVRVEPLTKYLDRDGKFKRNREEYYLPGVPIRQRFDGSEDMVKNLVESLKPEQKYFLHFVQRVSATLVLDEEFSDELVEKVRELTRQILGLNAKRGDTLDIQRTKFQKEFKAPVVETPLSKLQQNLKAYWVIISLSIVIFCIFIFLLFVFGPLRGFLNRFVQVLPMLKPVEQGGNSRSSRLEAQILPALLAQLQAQSMGMGPGRMGGGGTPSLSGSLMVENPNKKTTPFSFIREDHLNNLAILLGRETADKAAVVLGYLPPEWISRVLAKIEPSLQSAITDELATTKQLLPEQVEDIEQDLKRRLDYLIGGPDRIIQIYESLDPEGQRKMLENIRTARPDLAEELRKRTFLFEDLDRLDPVSLKTVLREVDLQTLVASLKGMSEAFRIKILENISSGKAEIVKEELEFAEGPGGKAASDAQQKIALMVRRLEREGQITLPSSGDAAPPTRFGESLKVNLKRPIGVEPGEMEAQEADIVSGTEEGSPIEERIRRFMSRGTIDAERFPSQEETKREEPPSREAKG